ncbi:ricin-type beta-trefoil lectin domain protein [Amycolatopsis sp. NPDC051716]|jgi:hypothetical protein|uniref:ricin-type beta-trefoil lectin domain protein n=1 Tax=Amycolatopsis sp. NPDC051716 TaxID=3155804 RepID=UPI00342C4A79
METRGMARRFAGAGAAAAFAATLLAGVATGAQAAGAATTDTATQGEFGASAVSRILYASDHRFCVDAWPGDVVQTMFCDGTPTQNWDNYTAGKFRNVGNGRCLGSDGAVVFTTACTSPSTNWTTTSGSPKKFTHVATGKCMHGYPAAVERVVVVECSGATRWSTLV